jgi:hypothetical protein
VNNHATQDEKAVVSKQLQGKKSKIEQRKSLGRRTRRRRRRWIYLDMIQPVSACHAAQASKAEHSKASEGKERKEKERKGGKASRILHPGGRTSHKRKRKSCHEEGATKRREVWIVNV